MSQPSAPGADDELPTLDTRVSQVDEVEVVTRTEEPEVAELCRLYWAMDSVGGYLHTVKELSARFSLPASQLAQVVRRHSEAYTINRRCSRCDTGFLVQSRSNLANLLRGSKSLCEECQREIAEIRKHEAAAAESARRQVLRSEFLIADTNEIKVDELGLRQAMTLAGLLRNGEDVADGTIAPLFQRLEKLAPTARLQTELTRLVFENDLVLIHPNSAADAFRWDENSRPTRFFPDRAAYYLAGVGALPERISRFHSDFENLISYDTWPPSWAVAFPDFWLEIAAAECSSYLIFQLGLHGLEFNPGEQTDSTIRKGLKWFSIGQLFNFIWRAARDAAAYKSREQVSRSQAANSAVTRLRAAIERAYAEGWTVPPYKRDSRLAVSTISHLLFTSALRLSDPLTFNPLLDSARSATKLQWHKLDAEQFERLIFIVVSETDGYADVDWLMKTNAPDHGRDVGAIRLRHDPLSGYTQERLVIQCKHWLTRSVKDENVSKEVTSVSHWDNPPVDVLIIATSGRFTADAVSWIERHNSHGARPRIEMWNDAKLEQLLAERPHLILSFELR